MLVGISSRAGPGGGLVAARNAMRRSISMVDQSSTRLVNLEKLRQMSEPYASWNDPRKPSVGGGAPARPPPGPPPSPATHSPVTAFVRPQPAVTASTPGNPLERA